MREPRIFPLEASYVLVISGELSSLMGLKRLQDEGKPIPAPLLPLIRTDSFAFAAAMRGSFVHRYFPPRRAALRLAAAGLPIAYYESFSGTADPVDYAPDMLDAFVRKPIADKPLCFLRPARRLDPFAAAYSSMDELVAEYETAIGPFLPDGVDVAAHVCDVRGTVRA